MIIKIALSEEEIKALNKNSIEINSELSDIYDSGEELTELEEDREDYLLTLSDILDRIVHVAINEQRIRNENNTKRNREVRRPLSEEEKEGLTDLEVFMKEYGLYTASMYSTYWRNKFIQTYGYTPELP